MRFVVQAAGHDRGGRPNPSVRLLIMRSCVLASWVFGAVAAAGRAPHGEGRRLDDGGELARWKLQRHAPSPPLRWAQSELRFMQHHMFYDAEHKLVMCMIPKVACTEWMRMILRLKGDARWRMEPHFLSNKPLVSQLPIENATHIMNDPSWTKAVFFRDPAERLESGGSSGSYEPPAAFPLIL